MSSVKKNFIYNTLYQLLAIVLPLITTPYISRVLGPDKIGIYSYSYSIAYYFVLFIMLGLNNYGNRTIAMVRDDKEKLSKTFISIYLMQLITSLIIIFIYIIYSIFLTNDIMIWIMLIYVISAAFDINWLFFGLEKFKITVIRNTFIKVITTLCIFIFVKKPEDIYLYAIIMVFGMLLSQMVMWSFVKKYIFFVKINIDDVLKHIKPNLILFIPVIAVSLYKQMDKIMLGMMANMTQVGFYESSEKILNVPLAIVNSLGTVMLPKISNLVANQNETEAKRYIQTSILVVMFLSTSMGFGIMGVSDLFVPLFYGDGYDQCIILFNLLLPSCMFLAFANVIRTQYLIPQQKDTIYIKSVFLGAIVNLIINALLIPKYQSAGAAIGTLFAEASVCIYQALKIRKVLPIKKYIKLSLMFCLIGILMYILLNTFVFSIENTIIYLLFKIIIGIIFYVTLSCIYLIYLRKKKIL